ncbi:hypothetical protein DENSPDRAFT_881900 [Dentipellis sp. KUC8613]|nr:hypothetical protein DENSPDRAFT_881900 [Dentipellis sp. KUC8613]
MSAQTSLQIVGIPVELLVAILTRLDYRDILRCTAVCRYFSDVVRSSVQLQYAIERGAEGMADGLPTHDISTAERLNCLLERRDNWRQMKAKKVVSLSLDDNCLAYELVSGVLAIVGNKPGVYGNEGRSHLTASWLPSTSQDERRVVFDDLGLVVKDFAMDPTQDLLALVEHRMDAMDNMIGDIQIHLRTLSTNQRHERAKVPVLRHGIQQSAVNSTMQIADDVIGMFLSFPCAGIFIWNWTTGEMLVNAYHEAWLVHDFSFLSSRAYMLTIRNMEGCLELFVFGENHFHVASLSLPEIQQDVILNLMRTHTGPFTAGAPPDAPFYVLPEYRVHVLTLLYIRPSPHRLVRMVIDHAALMSNITEYFETKAHSPILKRWADWGPFATRALDYSHWRHWLRYVHGRRVVFPGQERTTVLDFGLDCIRNPSGPTLEDYTDPSGCPISISTDTVTEPTELPAGGHFKAPIITRLPFRIAEFSNTASEHGIMIDDQRLIGLTEDAENNDELGEIRVLCY